MSNGKGGKGQSRALKKLLSGEAKLHRPRVQRSNVPEETAEDVGRHRGRVTGDPRFTPAERAASERLAQRETAKALERQREARRRARRF